MIRQNRVCVSVCSTGIQKNEAILSVPHSFKTWLKIKKAKKEKDKNRSRGMCVGGGRVRHGGIVSKRPLCHLEVVITQLL